MTVWPSPPLSADDRRPAPRDKRSDSGKGATIDDVLGAVDGAGTVGYQECDEFGGFGGQGGPPDRDAAEGGHEPLQCRIPADTCALGDAVDQPLGGLGPDESGCPRVGPH